MNKCPLLVIPSNSKSRILLDSFNPTYQSLLTAIDVGEDTIVKFYLELSLYSAEQVETAMKYAIDQPKKDAMCLSVQHLVDYAVRVYPGINLINSLNKAAEKGFLKIVKYILLNCTFCNERDKYISQNILSQYGSDMHEIVNLLIEHGFVVAPEFYKDYDFAYLAIENGHAGIVRQLLEHNMDANMINERHEMTRRNLFHVACKNQQLEIAKMLIEHKANVNLLTSGKMGTGKSSLYYSIFNNDVDLANLLLENGAELDKDPNFFEMIDNAIRCSYEEMITMLLKRIKSINVVDENNQTFLHSCCSPCIHPQELNFKCQLAEYLIKNGVDVNALTKSGNTPIFCAVRLKFFQMAELFLKNNAYLHDIYINRNNLLHLALERFDLGFIEKLLNHNIDVNHENGDFETPLLAASQLPMVYDKLQKMDLLLKHIIKLKCAGFTVNRKNMYYIYEKHRPDDDFNVDRFERDCEGEIRQLTMEKIGVCGSTLYDFLVKSDRRNEQYVRNQKIIMLLTSETSEKKFPIYINLIRNQIRLAKIRRNMLEKAKKYVEFTNLRMLTDTCVNKIFSNLSTLEINMFVSALDSSIKVERYFRTYPRV